MAIIKTLILLALLTSCNGSRFESDEHEKKPEEQTQPKGSLPATEGKSSDVKVEPAQEVAGKSSSDQVIESQTGSTSASVPAVKAFHSVEMTMDGDMQICLEINGEKGSITKSRVADKYAMDLSGTMNVETVSGLKTKNLTASAGTVHLDLPGNWKNIKTAAPIVVNWRRAWGNGNISDITYPTPSATQWCVKVIDGCCDKGGGAIFDIEWQLK